MKNFENHVENFDLDRVFQRINKANIGVKEIQGIADELFKPYIARFSVQSPWIEENWKGSANNFEWTATSSGSDPYPFVKAKSVLDVDPMQLQLKSTLPAGIDNAILQLFSNSSGHWNLGRRGGGVKSILKENDWIKIRTAPSTYVKNFNDALNTISKFDPSVENANNFYVNQCNNNKWSDLTDTSAPFHLVWPQYFPVLYRANADGTSQIEGINKLIDEISYRLGLKRNPLNLKKNYADYASAYRVLLLAYHSFVHNRPTLPIPHFDFLMQLLKELDPKAEAVQQLLTRKALILYGTPGTGKTYSACKEIATEIAVDNNIKVIQFHPGYSYADFIIGIRPKSIGGSVTYPVVPGILYRIAAEAAAQNQNYLAPIKPIVNSQANLSESSDESEEQISSDDPVKRLRYVLIIDEINRADLSRVLGEAMFVLENRGLAKSITLPNQLDPTSPEKVISVFDGTTILNDPFSGGAKFYLPDNLFIIGTMNHVDRSISGFDMALRRRFAWMKHEFSTTKLREILQTNTSSLAWTIANVESFVARCRALNDSIKWGGGTEKALGELPFNQDHVLGHTFFAEIVGIFMQDLPALQGTGIPALKIAPHHLEKLWLYSLKPQLEDALGYEAAAYADQMTKLRNDFIKSL